MGKRSVSVAHARARYPAALGHALAVQDCQLVVVLSLERGDHAREGPVVALFVAAASRLRHGRLLAAERYPRRLARVCFGFEGARPESTGAALIAGLPAARGLGGG